MKRGRGGEACSSGRAGGAVREAFSVGNDNKNLYIARAVFLGQNPRRPSVISF
jgi:hypothetical protein